MLFVGSPHEKFWLWYELKTLDSKIWQLEMLKKVHAHSDELSKNNSTYVVT